MNLLANAIDAIDEQSLNHSYQEMQNHPHQITIATEIIPALVPTEENSSNLVLSSQPTVSIQIQDNGPGIPPTIQQQIFDYLFTTKPIGKGTGLGLSISHKIITEKHHGQLWCRSELGQGAQFTITIPMT